MKKIIISILILLPTLCVHSQMVGIKTLNPLEALHVDGSVYIEGVSKMGGSYHQNTSTQIELGETNKGFLPNRVALVSLTSTSPLTNPVIGTIVHNITNTILVPYGYYYWSGNKWTPLLSQVSRVTANSYDLLASASSVATSANASENGTKMSIGNIVSVSPETHNYFEIQEPGSFVFALRIYGGSSVATGKNSGRACIFFTLLVNGVKKDMQAIDWSLVSSTSAGANPTVGGTAMLVGADLVVGDKVEFTVAHDDGGWSRNVLLLANFTGELKANRTSLTFWKL